jgi:hypothetical protein
MRAIGDAGRKEPPPGRAFGLTCELGVALSQVNGHRNELHAGKLRKVRVRRKFRTV